MLRVCTQEDFKQYAELAYQLALDQTKSGYPTYVDGIKTKEDFYKNSEKAFSSDEDEILLFEYEGVVKGWIHYYWMPEDRYLSTMSFLTDSHAEQAMEEFLAYVQERFSGYDLFLGYPTDNQKAIDFLTAHGFERIEESNNNSAFLEDYEPLAESKDIVRITKENFQYFRTLHEQIEGYMYWDSDRIYKKLDRWVIFVKLQEDTPLGAIYYTAYDESHFELFGFDAKDNPFDGAVFRDLLIKVLNTAKESGGKYVTFFCEDEELPIVTELGFRFISRYVGYQKRLD